MSDVYQYVSRFIIPILPQHTYIHTYVRYMYVRSSLYDYSHVNRDVRTYVRTYCTHSSTTYYVDLTPKVQLALHDMHDQTHEITTDHHHHHHHHHGTFLSMHSCTYRTCTYVRTYSSVLFRCRVLVFGLSEAKQTPFPC